MGLDVALDFKVNVPFSSQSLTVEVERNDNFGVVGERVELSISALNGFNLASPSPPFVSFIPKDHLVDVKWTITPPSGEPLEFTKLDRHIQPFKNRMAFFTTHGFLIPWTDGAWGWQVEALDGYGNEHVETGTFNVAPLSSLGIPASRTFILNDGSNLTGAPAHDAGNVFSDWGAMWQAFPTDSGPIRVAVQAGHTFSNQTGGSIRGDVSSVTGIFVEKFGGTSQTTLQIDANFGVLLNFGWSGTLCVTGDIVLQRQTPWRMNQGNVPQRTGSEWGICFECRNDVHANINLLGTTIDGWFYGMGTVGANVEPKLAMEDCDVPHYINFIVAHFGGLQSKLLVRGSRWDSPPDAFQGGLRHQGVTLLREWDNIHQWRFGNLGLVIFDANQGAVFHGWSETSQQWQNVQSIRIDQGSEGNSNIFFSRNLLEGGGITGSGQFDPVANNIVICRNVMLGASQGFGDKFNWAFSGASIYRNFFIGSSATRDPGTVQNKIGQNLTDRTADPFLVNWNTYIDYRAGVLGESDVGVDLGGVAEDFFRGENNLIHAPNYTTPITPSEAMVSSGFSITPQNTVGAVLGYVRVQTTEALEIGQTSAAIPWPAEVDGTQTNLATFSGGLQRHRVQHKLQSSGSIAKPFFPVTISDVGGGNFTFTVQSNGVTGDPATGFDGVADEVHIRLDRRHDPVARPNSSTPTAEGELLQPAANIPISTGSKAPVAPYDFFGNIVTGTACQGAIQVDAV